MAQWGGTEEADRGTTHWLWVWERLTWTILALGHQAGAGLVAWDMTGGAHRGDARGPRRPPRLPGAVRSDRPGRPRHEKTGAGRARGG